MNNVTRRLGAISLFVLGFGLAASEASAGEWDLDLRGGWYAKEAEGPFLGIGVLTQIGHGNWFANPNLEFAWGDEVDYWTVNGDVHYDFASEGSLTFWAGGGLALVNVNPDGPGDSETDLGLNLLVGLGKRAGDVRPFGQLKVIVSDETEIVLAGGVRF